MLVDDDYCAIGTANFDNRTSRLNVRIARLMAPVQSARATPPPSLPTMGLQAR